MPWNKQPTAGTVKVFMEIVNKTNLNSIQLNTLKILDLWWKKFPEKTIGCPEMALAGRS